MRLTNLASGRLRVRVRHWGDEAPSRSVPGLPKSTTSRTNGKTKAGARKARAILNRNKRGDTAIAPTVAIVDVCLDQDHDHDLTDRILERRRVQAFAARARRMMPSLLLSYLSRRSHDRQRGVESLGSRKLADDERRQRRPSPTTTQSMPSTRPSPPPRWNTTSEGGSQAFPSAAADLGSSQALTGSGPTRGKPTSCSSPSKARSARRTSSSQVSGSRPDEQEQRAHTERSAVLRRFAGARHMIVATSVRHLRHLALTIGVSIGFPHLGAFGPRICLHCFGPGPDSEGGATWRADSSIQQRCRKIRGRARTSDEIAVKAKRMVFDPLSCACGCRTELPGRCVGSQYLGAAHEGRARLTLVGVGRPVPE
jgi:hypothetical protein